MRKRGLLDKQVSTMIPSRSNVGVEAISEAVVITGRNDRVLTFTQCL